jgi:hypothetical protein
MHGIALAALKPRPCFLGPCVGLGAPREQPQRHVNPAGQPRWLAAWQFDRTVNQGNGMRRCAGAFDAVRRQRLGYDRLGLGGRLAVVLPWVVSSVLECLGGLFGR